MADPAATVQKRILEVLTQIEQLLTEVVDLQKPHVQRVCPACQDPCCKRVHYLYSEKDVLFLRLSGRQLRWRRETLKRKGCWFLGPDGCMLDPKSRPFICHSYVCPELEQEMEKEAPGDVPGGQVPIEASVDYAAFFSRISFTTADSASVST